MAYDKLARETFDVRLAKLLRDKDVITDDEYFGLFMPSEDEAEDADRESHFVI